MHGVIDPQRELGTPLRRVVLAALALCLLSGIVRGAQAQGSPGSPRPRVVLLEPRLAPETAAQLEDALLAQFALLEVELVLEPASSAAATETSAPAGAPAPAERPTLENSERSAREVSERSAREVSERSAREVSERSAREVSERSALDTQIASAHAAARKHDASLVLWLDATASGFLVSVLEVASDRLVVRRVEAQSESEGAMVEMVAVVARESARAMLAEEPVGSVSEPSPPPQAAEPQPQPTNRSPRDAGAGPDSASASPWARIGLAYLAQDFSEQTPIDHGALLTARLPAGLGAYAGVGFVVSPAAGPVGEENLRIQRFPMLVIGGYRLESIPSARDLRLDLELGLLLELLMRDLDSVEGATPDTTRVLFGFTPRVRAEWKPWNLLGFCLGAGLDILPTTLRYQTERPSETEPALLLRPHWFRPTLEVGLALYL